MLSNRSSQKPTFYSRKIRPKFFIASLYLPGLLSSCGSEKGSQPTTNQESHPVIISKSLHASPLIREWIDVLLSPRLSAIDSLKISCVETPLQLTLEWTDTALNCSSLLEMPENSILKHSVCLGEQLLQTKIPSCKDHDISHFVSVVHLPSTFSSYQRDASNLLKARNPGLPTIKIAPSETEQSRLDLPDLSEWLKTSRQSNAVGVFLSLKDTHLQTKWNQLLSFLATAPAPKLLQLSPEFLSSPPRSPPLSAHLLAVPRLIPSHDSLTPLCDYIQNWMRAHIALKSTAGAETRELISIHCTAGVSEPGSDFHIVATLALPLVERTTRQFFLTQKKDLREPKTLKALEAVDP